MKNLYLSFIVLLLICLIGWNRKADFGRAWRFDLWAFDIWVLVDDRTWGFGPSQEKPYTRNRGKESYSWWKFQLVFDL